MLPVLTESRARFMSSSDQWTWVVVSRHMGHIMSHITLTWVFLLSSIPTFLQRPYSVPLGIPNSAAAFWTGIPPLMASSAVLRSSWGQRSVTKVRTHTMGSPDSKWWPPH